MYLGWFDDNAKKTVETKITEAIAAYVARFGVRPAIVLTNTDDRPAATDVDGVPVRTEGFIRRHNFWVGMEAR